MRRFDVPPPTPRRVAGGRLSLRGYRWLDRPEALKRRKPGPGKDPDDGGILVEPDRPRNLSGGAAAALEFED